MGQSSGVLFKEVSAFQRCPLIEVNCVNISSLTEQYCRGLSFSLQVADIQ